MAVSSIRELIFTMAAQLGQMVDGSRLGLWEVVTGGRHDLPLSGVTAPRDHHLPLAFLIIVQSHI